MVIRGHISEMKFNCIFCKKEFETNSRKKIEHRFCSDECTKKASSFIERKWQRYGTNNCLICGNDIVSNKRLYCSDDCSTLGHRLRHLEYDIKRHRKDWYKRTVNSIKSRCVRRNIYFDDNIKKMNLVIPQYCPLLNIELKIGGGKNSPTIDRIDSTKGYTPDNIWIISKRANCIKNDANIEDLELITKNLKIKIYDKGEL